jgi:hypothetical protein
LSKINILFLYLIFSFIAAFLLILLVGLMPYRPSSFSSLEKSSIASIFILCCCVGISFTFKPNWIRQKISKSKNQIHDIQPNEKQSFQGHHPVCPSFQNHTIRWWGKMWCAGCLGLSVGLCISIALMLLYLIIEFQPTRITALLLLLLSFFILATVFIEIYHRNRHAKIHVFINSLLPLSFFILIITVVNSTGEVLYGFLSLLLCFLWLDTRIQLSKSHHVILCKNCAESCKMFSEPL